MKIKPGFNIRQVCGENIIVAEGEANIDFSNVISVNESAAVIWNAVTDREFSIKDMASALTAEYDVDEATAEADCKELAQSWIEAGLVNE